MSKSAGPASPGVHVNVQAKELPCDTVTVLEQLIGSQTCPDWKGGVGMGPFGLGYGHHLTDADDIGPIGARIITHLKKGASA